MGQIAEHGTKGLVAFWPKGRAVVLLVMLLIVGSGSSYSLFAAALPWATITLLPSAEVQGADILLGDIAQIEYHLEDAAEKPERDLAKVYVGRAPLPGKSRKLNVGTVEVRLRQAGIHPSTVAIIPPAGGEVLVTAATQTVTEDMVIDAVRQHLQENLGGSLEIGLQTAGGLPLVVPSGQLELRLDSVPPGFGSYQVGVRVYVDDHWYRTIQVRVQLQPSQAAAPRPGRPGVEVGLPTQDQSVQGIQGEPLESAIDNGTSLILVRAGEPVVIEVVSGAIRVEALGRARQRGKLGDVIRVENVDSRKIVTARVVAKGVVRLDLNLGN